VKKQTRILLVVAALAVSIASFSLISPKAVKAAIATLIRDQDNPARHPFTANCFGGSVGCAVQMPAGVEVVIQTASVTVQTDLAGTAALVNIVTNIGGNTSSAQWVISNPFDRGPVNLLSDVRNLTLYADPNTLVQCSVVANSQISATVLTVTGYYVTLP
jgi:hypothetical protein